MEGKRDAHGRVPLSVEAVEEPSTPRRRPVGPCVVSSSGSSGANCRQYCTFNEWGAIVCAPRVVHGYRTYNPDAR
ncbi:MAG: hypothetical protein ACJAYU_000385 [Bradymonadia bacterium]|jgi:hypothetical protein